MAAGEYVSVSSQRDTEKADLALETRELREDPEGELAELTAIYEGRGVSPDIASRVFLMPRLRAVVDTVTVRTAA